MKKTLSILSLAAVAAASQAAFNDTSHIYGLAKEGGIYKINTATGSSTLIDNTLVVNSQGGTNGLAYDNHGTFYYYSGNTLYKNNGSESAMSVTGFKGANANATFYQGDYMFVSGDNKIGRVDVGASKLDSALTINGIKDGYGDIAIDGHGMIYASLTSGKMQKYSVSGGSVTNWNSNVSPLQLGFNESGNLFGIAYDTGKIYSIDTNTGSALWTNAIAHSDTIAQLHINDAASVAAVPEPGTVLVLVGGIGAFLRRRIRK